MKTSLPTAGALVLLVLPTTAEVVSVEVRERALVLDGREFGEVGAYEKLVGTIRFEFHVANEANEAITDLALAPRGDDRFVEASADLMVLRPVAPERGSGTALLEVSNRGSKASLSYFNRARGSSDPTDEAHFGDGFLMRRGLTLIWVGWQHDVPLEPGRLRLTVPVARDDEGPITGLVRCDWTVDAPAATLAGRAQLLTRWMRQVENDAREKDETVAISDRFAIVKEIGSASDARDMARCNGLST